MNTLNTKPTTTEAYKQVGKEKHSVTFDLYLPSSATATNGVLTLPTVVYFHPGGLVAGDKTWFPKWLYDRVMSLGYAFLSANYRLLPPGTVHEVIQDIQDLFTYMENTDISLGDQGVFKADMNRVAVTGSSSGGHCAYLAAIHCVPRPRAIFTMYAIGGSVFVNSPLPERKNRAFLEGRDLLDPAPFKQFLYPFPDGSKDSISESPEVPDNIRGALPSLYFQLAVVLDHYTGLHEPSLSAKLRNILEAPFSRTKSASLTQPNLSARQTRLDSLSAKLRNILEENPNATLGDFEQAIPVSQRYTFPELNVSSAWPPTLSIHGDADTAVLVSESQDMRKLLIEADVDASLIIAPGQEHLFDMDPNSEARWGKEYDAVKDFLFKNLGEP